MSDIEDPIAALRSKSIATRSAGARSLSLHGSVEDIPLLLEHARDDRSPAVRLISCSASADILSRYRVGARAKTLSLKRRAELVALINRVDPGQNTAIFSVIACLDLPEGIKRMAVGMRDPRGRVRLGAAVGLWRHVISASQCGNKVLEEQLLQLLKDSRLPTDSLAEMGRICAAAGYSSAISRLQNLDLVGTQGELLSSCLEVLEGLDQVGAGFWWSDGRDGGEVSADPALPPAGQLVTEDGVLMGCDGSWSWTPASAAVFSPCFFRRVGQAEADHVLHGLGRTWFRMESTILDMIDLAMDVPRLQVSRVATVESERARHLLGSALPESSSGDRARGLLALGVGDLSQARDCFVEATQQKKTPPDTWFLLGETLQELGEEDEAREAWTLSIDKARRKRDWHVARARARLA